MLKYDNEHHNPPAPVAWVSLINLETGSSVNDVPMLIDSGADVTLLPINAVRELGLEIDTGKGYEVEGFDGTRSTAPVVLATLVLGSFRFKGQYLVDDRSIGVLGRNILNAFVLELNGPRLVIDIRRT